MTNKTDNKIIIEGVTPDGRSFRPSDWADRLSGRLATFRNQRIIYSPLLRPGVRNGHKCVIVDKHLKETNPELWHHTLEFARINLLKIIGDWEED